MANQIPLAYADVELQLSTALSVGSTTFSVADATDDDGNSLPAGKYCFTVDNGTSQKEYLLGQLNGTDITSVVSVSRQGVESSGAARTHRIGAPVILTDFATIQRVADILRGQENLDGSNPILYDAEPTLADRKELATVGYVLDNISGGTVAFDAQTITGNAGETVSAGDLIYFKTSDQEWYQTDADTAATVEGVQIGIALGSGTDGVSISGGIQISGTYTTTGLTAGSTYYASNTAGAYGTSAGTTELVIGVALSTTKLLLVPRNPQTPTSKEKAALAGAGAAPTSSNKFLTEDDVSDVTLLPPIQVVPFTSSGTWTKDAGLKYVVVEVVGGGGGGDGDSSGDHSEGGGGGGGYSRKLILASALGSTETVTIGSGGSGGPSATGGGTTSFGAHCQATGGSPGVADVGGVGGVGSGGDINVGGQDGGDQRGNTGTTQHGGNGGSSILGGGGKGNNTGAGQPGNVYGGGGGGGADTSGPGVGGDGAAGIVIVTEYYT